MTHFTFTLRKSGYPNAERMKKQSVTRHFFLVQPFFFLRGFTAEFRGYFLLAFFWALFSNSGFAQCPSAITTGASVVTAADCPSSGQILVHSSAESEPLTTYQITSGPLTGGYQTTAQSSNNFTGLPAGTYTIRIKCGTVTADVTEQVPDNYKPLSLTASVTDVCQGIIGGGSGGNNRISGLTGPGGTITATATGGRPALTYAFLLSNNPAEPDANFSYGSSNSFTATTYGVYQVRVKDACNNFITQSIDVEPLYPKAKLSLGNYSGTCSEISFTGNNLVRTSDSTEIDPTNLGYKVEFWYISSTDACSVPVRSADQGGVIYSNNDLSNFTFPSTTERVIIRITSPCGEVSTECVDIPKVQLVSYATVHLGCSPTDDVNLALNIFNGTAPYNVSVQGYDSANIAVAGTSKSFVFDWYSLVTVPAADHYVYTVTDACGRSLTKTITTPTPSDAPAVGWFSTSTSCVNTVGSVNVNVQVNGFIPSQDLSNIKLVNASTGAFVANSSSYDFANGSITFDNIPAGDYKIIFTPVNSACPPSESPFTIPASTQVLDFSLNGTTNQFCGGSGTINTVLNYNGSQTVTFQLFQGSTMISSNASGSFTNLASGVYTVKAVVDMSSCHKSTLEASKELTIEPSGSDPVVVKKLGINCTSSPAQGIAVFEFSGFGPFLLEMKKTTEANFTTIGTSVPNTYTATGLSSDTDYDVRITDKCGKTSVTQVSVKPLVAVYVTNSAQPCQFSSYTLSAENISEASYSWTFNGGPVMSTSREIIFGSYLAGNDGTYVCTITLGDCITKVLTVNLNSINCGQTLDKSGIGDYVWIDSNKDGIQTPGEIGVAGVTVTLYGQDGSTIIASTVTDTSGYYNFPNLSAGSYVVGFSDFPSNYVLTTASGSLNDATNSDANTTTGKTSVIVLAANEFNLNVDAGIYNELMPVTLISFTAKAIEGNTVLNWVTSMETNSDHFDIERSQDTRNWSKIASVISNGESASVISYQYTDKKTLAGQNFYRLRMVDRDNTFSYSRIQQIKMDAGAVISSVFPNPVSDRLFLDSRLISSVKEVEVVDINGREVYHFRGFPMEGINVKKLSEGIHIIKILDVNGVETKYKFLVVK